LVPAEVFGRGGSLDDIAAKWIGRFKSGNEAENDVIADFFTFLFKCAGYEHKVEPQTLEDPDSFSSQIDDIQQQYQAVCLAER
jgi:hypothetical protein